MTCSTRFCSSQARTSRGGARNMDMGLPGVTPQSRVESRTPLLHCRQRVRTRVNYRVISSMTSLAFEIPANRPEGQNLLEIR